MIPVTITVAKDGGALVFTPHDCESLSYVQSTSFDGDTVQADEISVVIRRRQNQTAADFLALWRGVNGASPVLLQSQGGRLEKYFFKPPLRRIGEDKYQLDAQSPLARLSADFPGGVYNAATLPDVIAEVIGGAVPYECNSLLGSVRIYGWAPYQSRRESLHALAFAYGFLIRRNAAQDLYFTVPDTAAYSMPYNSLFTGGSVAYSVGETYYRAQITARDYRQDPYAAPVTLFDNSGGVPAERLIVKFDKPIFDLAADGLEIIESGVNHAIVSGVGVLTGKPYAEYVSAVTVDGDPDADPERVLTVEDAPLITSLNAASVAERLLAYRNAEATVNADIVRTVQKPGDCIAFTDPFGDARTGYITALSGSITSIDRAAASIVCGYTPSWGAAYDALEVLTQSGEWTAPAYLDGKTVRVVLIGGGQGGASGQHGSDAAATGSGRGLPGAGGNVLDVKITVTAGQAISYSIGVGGAGGTPTGESSDDLQPSTKVYESDGIYHLKPHGSGTFTPTTLDKAQKKGLQPCQTCLNSATRYYVSNPGQAGTHTTFGDYDTDDSAPMTHGFFDIIDGDTYAAPGTDNGVSGGQATAATENGERESPAYIDIQRFALPLPWDDSQGWQSGNVGNGASKKHTDGLVEWGYGGLGGGAAVGADGGDGFDVANPQIAYQGGNGGNGGNALAIFPFASRAYGSGGSGGHGGGEGGKGGSGNSSDPEATGTDGIRPGAQGQGGSGSAGQDGADGCILIYFKKPNDFGQFRFRVPPGTGEVVLDYYTETPPPFFADENNNLYYAYPEGETPPNFVRRGKQIYLITN